MANYKLSIAAKNDLVRIYRYGLNQFGEAVADKYYNELFDHFEQIAEQPFSYASVQELKEGYRRSVCGVESIFYKVDKEGVEIMRILGRQDSQIHL